MVGGNGFFKHHVLFVVYAVMFSKLKFWYGRPPKHAVGGLPEHADLDFPSVLLTMRVLEIHHCNLDHMIIVKK